MLANVGFQILLCVSLSVQLFALPAVKIEKKPSWIIDIKAGGNAPGKKDFSDGYYVAFSDSQYHVEKQTVYFRSIRQIANESGIQNGSEISVVFDPTYERVIFHNIIIWRGSTPISQLKSADFKMLPLESERQRFIYDGSYSASLILKDIRKGDRIEYDYSVVGENPVFQNKFSTTLGFGAFDYISHRHCAIITEKGRPLNFKEFNKPPQKVVKKTDAGVLYEWDVKNVKGKPQEDYTPSWFSSSPFVQVSEFKNWQEVVNWGLPLYEIPDVSQGPLKSKILAWQKEAKGSKPAFISAAVRFVQDEIRYVGVETGVNSHKPHSPEDVFKQRYGDCKDKAFLLCAILKANHIECAPLLVNTYKKNHLSESLASPLDFNHVVVHISVEKIAGGKDFLLVDATMSLQGGAAGQINFPNYGQGLLLKKGQNGLISLPQQDAGFTTVHEEITIPGRIDTTRHGKIMAKTVYSGLEADDFRVQLQQGSFSETEKSYLNYYQDLYRDAEVEATDTTEVYDQREANNISLVERYSMNGGWVYDSTEKNYYFRIPGRILYDQLLHLPNRTRHGPLALKFPYKMDYTIEVVLDGRKNIENEQWYVKRDAYEMRFKSTYMPESYKWELAYAYKTFMDHVPVEQLAQYRSDVEKMSSLLDYQLTDYDGIENASADPLAVGDLNTGMIIFIFSTLIACIRPMIRLTRYSPLKGFQYPAWKINGWLIILGIWLVLGPSAVLISWLNGGCRSFYTIAGWDAWAGESELSNFLMHCGLVVAVFIQVFLFTFSILLVYLFFKRRDSFVNLFIVNGICSVLFMVIYACFEFYHAGYSVFTNVRLVTIIISSIFLLGWILYLMKSYRSKRTFVNTFEDKAIEPAIDVQE